MIYGVSIYEILTLTSILFFIGVYGFITRTNLISVLISVELILNSSVVNFVVINKYLYPDVLQGVFFSVFIIAVAAAETALAIAIIINLYRLISSVEVKDTEVMKYQPPQPLRRMETPSLWEGCGGTNNKKDK